MKPPLNQNRVIQLVRAVTGITVANSAITPILNTTLNDSQAQSSTVVGPRRGQYQGLWLVVPFLKATSQNVTLTLQHLVTGAWASMIASEVPLGRVGGANVIVASATEGEGFSLQIYGDVNVFVTNGGTGPGVLEFGTPYLTDSPPGRW